MIPLLQREGLALLPYFPLAGGMLTGKYKRHEPLPPGTYHPLLPGYAVPTILPAKGRIEVIRYIRSDRRLELFGKRVTLGEEHTHQYVVATIRVRAKEITVVSLHGETVHDSAFALSQSLR